jgi:DNA (cytosine-5)-methyltransferase 1
VLTVGSLFAGIGGFDLGLERAGMQVRWQVEIDPFCRAVLAKHWPDVRRYDDVRTVGAELEWVDVLCGGFPCQDISIASTGADSGLGLDGDRSGLWREYARIIGELRPRYVVVENSPALVIRGLERVLADFAELGMDAIWTTIRASDVGARHRRERMFICAHAHGDGLQGRDGGPLARIAVQTLGDDAHWPAISAPFGCRSADGIPARVDRTHALGNAVVPQIAEWIGRRIVEADGVAWDGRARTA